ncbi:MAG: hypothetical protein CMB77_08015 [Euryarchaeota archaeon]|nr:hypothetical protein [Euryarchaeota archaeon]
MSSPDLVTMTPKRALASIELTKEARRLLTPLSSSPSHLGRALEDMLRMCDDYVSDAMTFLESGDLIRAHAAASYAHAWLDASVRLGLADGHGDDRLFTLP